jgi:MSHA biogenesis protein MshQ
MVGNHWAQANECSAVFPDGLQNNTTQGTITFGFNSTLESNPDAILESSNQISSFGGFPTCVNGPCTSSGTPALAVSYTIPSGGSGNATLTTSTTLAPGNYNNYQVNSGVTLTLSAGDYIFNDLTLISTSQIIIAGANDVVRIFVKDEASIGNNTQINVGGDPSNLLLYFSNDTTFISDSTPNRSNTNAFIYSDADIKLGSGAKLTGAINANKIDLISASSVIFDDTVPDFGDFCEPQQITPILEYRFDECGYTGDAGDVIDNTGIFNGTTTDILSPKLNGKINSSIDMASINSDPFKFITVPKEAIHGLDDFTLATWVKNS